MYGKPVNTQELADEIAISRPAVRKYLKPNDRREVTVPSALVVSRIARYFRTTPNFLLGFDEAADSEGCAARRRERRLQLPGLEPRRPSTACNRLHAQAVTDPKAAELQRLLDKLYLQLCTRGGQAAALTSRTPRTGSFSISVRGCSAYYIL
ncbi:MAG: hypothetical protein ACLSHG_13035 [Oscillospiraceae bacterium]